MKENIIQYLKGTRPYYEGVALYEKYGFNKMLKAQFRKRGECEQTKGALLEELRKLAGLSDLAFTGMQRVAYVESTPEQQQASIKVKKPFADDLLLQLASEFNVSVEELTSDGFFDKIATSDEYRENAEALKDKLLSAKEKYAVVPEPMRKTIKFREEFPFLNTPDCPDELKILVSDMFTAYDLFRQAHAKLVDASQDMDKDELYQTAKTAVEGFLDNREMWDELEYYKENGKILGKAQIFSTMMEKNELGSIPDLKLAQLLGNAKSNVSKAKKALDKAVDEDSRSKATASFEKWDSKRKLIQEEIESRKKN